jgi:hypothetical protein
MASVAKTMRAVLSGRCDTNIRFASLRLLVKSLGFAERITGDHFIYTRTGVIEIINIQPGHGGKAKPYQVKQVRGIITGYGLGTDD